MQIIKRTLRKSAAERRLICWWMICLPAAELALKLGGFGRTQHFIGRLGQSAPCVELELESAAMVEYISSTLRSAQRYVRLPNGCLSRSMLLRSVLLKHGVPATLKIGVRSAGPFIEAHAWLETDDGQIADTSQTSNEFLKLGSSFTTLKKGFVTQ